MQTTARLKTLLMQAGINFTRHQFNTDDGIEGLGQPLFVSSFVAQALVNSYANIFYTVAELVHVAAVAYFTHHINIFHMHNILQEPQTRIFIIISYSPHARRLMCKVRILMV